MKFTVSKGVIVGATLGLALGVGAFTFVYAKGGSYLTNDPAACANCHIMREHYDAWIKSSHRHAAVCNDCHTPHGLLPKYLTKADNGFFHSLHFTTGRFPDPLRLKPRNREIIERACRRCHAMIVQDIDRSHRPGMELSCIRCHSQAGHAMR